MSTRKNIALAGIAATAFTLAAAEYYAATGQMTGTKAVASLAMIITGMSFGTAGGFLVGVTKGRKTDPTRNAMIGAVLGTIIGGLGGVFMAGATIMDNAEPARTSQTAVTQASQIQPTNPPALPSP